MNIGSALIGPIFVLRIFVLRIFVLRVLKKGKQVMDLAKTPTETKTSVASEDNLANNRARTDRANEGSPVETVDKVESRSINPAGNGLNIPAENKENNRSNQTKETTAAPEEPVAPQPRHGSPQNSDNYEQVPERPSRGPEVELSGEMQETGFEHQQWLVQRGGQFVQLPEILYPLPTHNRRPRPT
jgi:hypothetical protein